MKNIKELISKLEAAFPLESAPQCHLCGHSMAYQSFRNGGAWVCTGKEGDGSWREGRSNKDEHYDDSIWISPSPQNRLVHELIFEYKALSASRRDSVKRGDVVKRDAHYFKSKKFDCSREHLLSELAVRSDMFFRQLDGSYDIPKSGGQVEQVLEMAIAAYIKGDH